ncbi:MULTISPECIES: helix-turn-helix domain-containing protein [unclassified Streptomyces]|uniref:helix-turn-helix domain-containing protein n=1 Tax=unclassified Streptomyces TaxID=2593676 RepID=UPI0036312FEF
MYAERASRLPGAVVWSRVPGPPAPGADSGRAASGAGPGEPPATPVAAVLPDGCMDLLWTEGRLLVAGPDTGPYVPDEVSSGGGWAGVRFFPGTAPTYLGVPADELRDRRVELTDLWAASEVRRLAARIDAADDPVTALEDVALRRAADTEQPDPVLLDVVAALDAGRPVARTADELGLGARQLHRRSLTAFGYGPKTLARVLRLQRALALARDGVPFAETALRAGFADQAHLARDVRELAGATLGELVARR